MKQPDNEFRDLARSIAREALAHEAKGDQNPSVEELADAAQRTCQRISQQMANLIGPAGVHALMARALHLAKVDPSMGKAPLNGVEVESPSGKEGLFLKGLNESVKGQEPAEVRRSMTALLANYILVLSSLIGEDLALRELARTWPDVQVSPSEEEVKD